MRILSLNGNLFGPNTNYGQGGTLDAAYHMSHTSFNVLIEIESIVDGKGIMHSGEEIASSNLEGSKIYVTSRSYCELDDSELYSSIFGNSYIPRETITFSDTYDGTGPSTSLIATNFPFAMNDYHNSRIFCTKDFRPVASFKDLVNNTYGTESAVTLMCFENVVFKGTNEPLYSQGGPLEQTAEFFQPVMIYQALDEPLEIIEEPILYLNFPGSNNYNIFFHEHLPAALALPRLPENTKVMIGDEDYKRGFLCKIGVNPRSIYANSNRSMRLKKVFVPLRKLNLKSIDQNLIRTYHAVRSNIPFEYRESSNHVKRNVFLSRRINPENSGQNRFITNQADLDACLSENLGFDIVYGETLSIEEKFIAISNSKIVVTPIGANVVNIGIAKNIEFIILIASPVWWHFKKYWQSLMQKLHPNAKVIIFDDCNVLDNHLSNDPFNKPFEVNIDSLKLLINSLS